MNALTSLSVYRTPWPAPLGACAAALGDRILRLQDDASTLLQMLYRFPQLNIATRNDAARLHQGASYTPLVLCGDTGVAALRGPGFAWRASPRSWALSLAVLAPLAGIPARTFLFFDRCGRLLHEVQVPEGTAGMAFEELACNRLHPDQHQVPVPNPLPLHSSAASVDLAVLEQDWSVLADHRDFTALLQRYGISRLGAYCRVRDKFARAVRLDSVPALLALAAARRTPVRLQVFSGGCEQRYEGVLPLPVWADEGVCLRQPGLDFRLLPRQIASVWRVRMPAGRGGSRHIATRIELFDHRDERVMMLSCAGSSSGSELPSWRALLGDCLMPPDAPG